MTQYTYIVTWAYITRTVRARNIVEAITLAIEVHGDYNNIIEVKLVTE